MVIGDRITELRTTLGMSQYALCKRTGVAQGALSQYEAGLKTPGVDTLERICDGFGISLAEFFQEDQTGRQSISLNDQERDIIASYRALNESRKCDVSTVLHCLANLDNEAPSLKRPSSD